MWIPSRFNLLEFILFIYLDLSHFTSVQCAVVSFLKPGAIYKRRLLKNLILVLRFKIHFKILFRFDLEYRRKFFI